MNLTNKVSRFYRLLEGILTVLFSFNGTLKDKILSIEGGILHSVYLLTNFNLIRNAKKDQKHHSGIITRQDFASIVPKDKISLEIGPFADPLLIGPNVRYCDVLSQEELIERAIGVGKNPQNVPKIDFIVGSDGLGDISISFESILSSHNIEHHPDLLKHLNQVESKLTPRGKFYALIPDKRFCFDRIQPVSTIADVLEAHFQKRHFHSLKSIIEHRCLTVSNNSDFHWQTINQHLPWQINIDHIKLAINEWENSKNVYVDVHAWYFTPESFEQIISTLHDLKLTKLKVSQMFPTRFGANEFWVILEKTD